ncbi:ras-domain-containing protein [Ramicandelaber brevisporus]|nr:ras-domain-containing protein [Ramicandelaber brevisporus]
MSVSRTSTASFQQDYDHVFKVLLVGDSSVGKTSLLIRFADDIFTSGCLTTIGLDFRVRTIPVVHDPYRDTNPKVAKLMIWDTSGQDRFRTVIKACYRGTHGFIVAFSLADRESFQHLEQWLKDVDDGADAQYRGRTFARLLVGNKSDLVGERQVSYEEALQFANDHGMTYIETSAKDSTGVNEAFERLAKDMVSNVIKTNNLNKPDQDRGISLTSTAVPPALKPTCCT